MRTLTVPGLEDLPPPPPPPAPSWWAVLWLTMVPSRLEDWEPTPCVSSRGCGEEQAEEEPGFWAREARARMLKAWLMSMLYVPSDSCVPVVTGAELDEFWKDIERVAVGGPLVVLGSSAGEAATATLTSVSNAALLLFVCCGREAIMDFKDGVPPAPPLAAGPAGESLRRV